MNTVPNQVEAVRVDVMKNSEARKSGRMMRVWELDELMKKYKPTDDEFNTNEMYNKNTETRENRFKMTDPIQRQNSEEDRRNTRTKHISLKKQSQLVSIPSIELPMAQIRNFQNTPENQKYNPNEKQNQPQGDNDEQKSTSLKQISIGVQSKWSVMKPKQQQIKQLQLPIESNTNLSITSFVPAKFTPIIRQTHQVMENSHFGRHFQNTIQNRQQRWQEPKERGFHRQLEMRSANHWNTSTVKTRKHYPPETDNPRKKTVYEKEDYSKYSLWHELQRTNTVEEEFIREGFSPRGRYPNYNNGDLNLYQFVKRVCEHFKMLRSLIETARMFEEVDKASPLWQSPDSVKLLVFGLIRRYHEECKNMIQSLKGETNRFVHAECYIPDEALDEHCDKMEVKQICERLNELTMSYMRMIGYYKTTFIEPMHMQEPSLHKTIRFTVERLIDIKDKRYRNENSPNPNEINRFAAHLINNHYLMNELDGKGKNSFAGKYVDILRVFDFNKYLVKELPTYRRMNSPI